MIDKIKNELIRILKEKIRGSLVFSFIMTCLYLYGDIAVYEKPVSLISIVKYAVVFIVYYCATHFVYYLVNYEGISLTKKIKNMVGRYLLLLIFVFIFMMWLPHLIMKYPVGNNYDTYHQLLQGLGYEELRAHYPLFHTILMSSFYRFGQLLGNANVGMFLFAIIEAITLDLIFTFALSFLINKKTNDLVMIISLIFICFCPYVIGYIGQSIYDIFYSGFVVLFVTMIAIYVDNKTEFWNKKSNIILLLISAILMVLFRKNGKYVIIPTVICIIADEIRRNRRFDLRIVFLLSLVILPQLSYSALEKKYNPIKGSIREALSLPFQQTARFVKYHGDLVSQEEKEAINRVLPYDRLPELYKEYISDPVKGKFNDNYTTSDLVGYFKVWFVHFFRSPLTYVDATMRQNIYLVYPRYSTYVYFIDCNNELVENQEDGLLQTPLIIKQRQEDYLNFLYFLHLFPAFYFINNMATFMITFLFCVLLVFNSKQYSKLLIYLPIVLSILIIIASPGIAIHTRYSFPVLWSFPIWFATARKKENTL